MSAPDTNLRKQKQRHIGPLTGIVAMLVLVAMLFVGYLAYNAATDTPAPEASQVEPRQGLPAEGIPVTPQTQPEAAPQIIEPQPAPDAD